MELSGVEVAVIGLGASGSAAARLAVEKGAQVYVSDTRTNDAVAARGADLGNLGVEVELGSHDEHRLSEAEVVVASPGIPPDAPVLRGLTDRGVEWISEPEFASRFYRSSLIGITGTNGKTTTTLLVDHLLRASGISSAAGGNVGGGLAPAASELALLDPAPDWIVLEMSSFQLAGCRTFRPDIGMVTNLSPDHLDRYATVDDYYADKARIFDNADSSSRWVLPAEDARVEALAEGVPGERFLFGEGAGSDAFVDNGMLTLRSWGEVEELLPRAELPLLGEHNVTNALSAALLARLAGAAPGGIAAGLGSARPLPHRLESVLEAEGVLWVNDSKATNVAATESALRSIGRPMVLLLGGKDKGEDFAPLVNAAVGRAHTILVYGEAADRVEAALSERLAKVTAALVATGEFTVDAAGLAIEKVPGSLESVVSRASRMAHPGDVILLSPACSSYDAYTSYEHRGRHFVDLVKAGAA